VAVLGIWGEGLSLFEVARFVGGIVNKPRHIKFKLVKKISNSDAIL